VSVEHCSIELVTVNSTSLASVCVHALMLPDSNLSLNTTDVFGSGVGIGLGVEIGLVVGIGVAVGSGVAVGVGVGVWIGWGVAVGVFVGAGVVFGVGLGVVVGFDVGLAVGVEVGVGSGSVLFVDNDSKPIFDMTEVKPTATIKMTKMPIARLFFVFIAIFYSS